MTNMNAVLSMTSSMASDYEYLTYGPPVPHVLFSVGLHLVLYIGLQGELRLTPDCQNAMDPYNNSIEMLWLCEDTANNATTQLCLMASKSKEYLLAMERRTGRLITVKTPAQKPPRSGPTSDTCVWFRVVKKNRLFAYQVTGNREFVQRRQVIFGCPDSHRFPLILQGERLRHATSCEAASRRLFSQVLGSSTSQHGGGPRHRHFVTLDTYGARQSATCMNASLLRERCDQAGGQYRHSYPLNWAPCEGRGTGNTDSQTSSTDTATSTNPNSVSIDESAPTDSEEVEQ